MIDRHTRVLTEKFLWVKPISQIFVFFRYMYISVYFNLLTFRVRGKLVVAVAGSRLSAIMPKESIGDCSTVECAAAAAAASAAADVVAGVRVLVARCCPCAGERALDYYCFLWFHLFRN